ncbi:MAG: type III pantothenate kinase [Gammaproteobacteria bacterium]|nr:type III pantothenate kinase [Gammaproteobacteria bacterium]
MLLCLDVGNSHIFGGVFTEEKLHLSFRHPSKRGATSDQIGIFLRTVLRENNLDPVKVKAIIICSVVPAIDYSLASACIKYFNLEPLFLRPGVKTGLKIRVKNPLEVGADRIANAIAAINQFPEQNILVVDLGTATTFCATSANKEFLGGAIMPGLRISMEALSHTAAKLAPVSITRMQHALGTTTNSNIQSGLYFGQLGALRELTSKIKQEAFGSKPTTIIGTGGFAQLFETENIFTTIIADLSLHGLRIAYGLND